MNRSLLKAAHQTAKDLHKIGIIDNVTMREFDALCLSEVKPMGAKAIQKLRQQIKLSQPVFAHILNVSPSSVKHWETGEKRPGGAALKLLNLLAQKGLAAII
jgi:putative transcriptional regulator